MPKSYVLDLLLRLFTTFFLVFLVISVVVSVAAPVPAVVVEHLTTGSYLFLLGDIYLSFLRF